MIRFVGSLAAIALAFWVHHDPMERGKTPGKALAWAVRVFLLWIVFLPLWIFTRPKLFAEEGSFGNMKVCQSCGGYVDREASFYPHCGHRLS